MKRFLLALLGLLILAVLAYFCFQQNGENIKSKLVTNAQNSYSVKGMDWVDVKLQGDELESTRILTLSGDAPSFTAKQEAGEIARNIKGVKYVNNLLSVEGESEFIGENIVLDEEEVTVSQKDDLISEDEPKVNQVSPYFITIKKDKDGKVSLIGYANDEQMHESIVNEANSEFGKDNVTDNMKVVEGSPESWKEMSLLGVQKLSALEYGEVNIEDSAFKFSGLVANKEDQGRIVTEMENALANDYVGSFAVDCSDDKVMEDTPSSEKKMVPKTPEKIATEVKEKDKPKSKKDESKDNENRAEISKDKNTRSASKEDKSGVSNITSCQKLFNDILSKKKINFKYDKADIRKNSFNLLNSLVSVAKKCDSNIITIEGHTDSIGRKSYNRDLSQRRAESIKMYLIKKGVNKNNIKAIGYGESRPIGDNFIKAGRAKNRRIEFKISKGEK